MIGESDIAKPAVSGESDIPRRYSSPPMAKFGIAKFGQSKFGSQAGGTDIPRPLGGTVGILPLADVALADVAIVGDTTGWTPIARPT